ncbi:MucR family transcriptional regulator [Streptomyces qinglanensis]|nr:MucR family transcriptional regulator [Streptomyces qinglanensis]
MPRGTQPEDAAGRLQCLECGRWYRRLDMHLHRGEDMTPDDYRERHGLAAGHPLVSPELSDRWREQARARHARGELASIAQRQSPEERRAAGRSGNTRHVATAPRPEVRAIHRATIVKGRSQAHANKRAALEALARGLGHSGWESFIRDTAQLSLHEVGRRAGRDPRTIAYWRRKILGDGWVTAGARLQPRRAAAFARLDAEFAARGWGDLAAARRAVGRRGLKGVAAEVGSTPSTLLAWEEHRRPGQGSG